MAEHPNVQTTRDAYAALAAGDLTGALKNLAPAGVVHFSGTGPLSGNHMGADSIKAALVAAYALTEGTQRFCVKSVYADDHHAVVVIRESASRPDGASLDVEEVHLLAFDSEGRTTDIWNLPSDPELHDRFFDGI